MSARAFYILVHFFTVLCKTTSNDQFFVKRVYTCDFWCNFCRALQCNFCHKCKLAAIMLRFQCDVCCNFPQIAAKLLQVSNMFEISAISRRQIAQKSPLVYTCNVYRKLERDKTCTEKCDRNCTKSRMCKRTCRKETHDGEFFFLHPNPIAVPTN